MVENTYKKRKARQRASRFTSQEEIRKKVFKRDGYKCLKCGSKENLTLDHIISVYQGGENSIDNLQTLCMSCNCGKAPRDTTDYRSD